MKDEEREEYLREYEEKKKKGVPFWPDIIFKDTIVAFVIFHHWPVPQECLCKDNYHLDLGRDKAQLNWLDLYEV